MCRIHICLFLLNWSKCTAGHANSVRFRPDRNRTQAIWVSVNLLTDTRGCFIWRSWITSVSRELRVQCSSVIKNTYLGITWSEDENKMPSNSFWRQSEPSEVHSYIHLYNSFSTLLKPPSFSALFSVKTKLFCCLCARETVTENCDLCWTVFIYRELVKSW